MTAVRRRPVHPDEAEIRALALGRLAPEAARRHLESCAPCRDQVRLLAGIAAAAARPGPCPETTRLIALADRVDLHPAEALALAAHVGACRSCASDLEALERAAASEPRRRPAPAPAPATTTLPRSILARLRRLVEFQMPLRLALTPRRGVARGGPAYRRAMSAYGAGRYAEARRGLLAAGKAGEASADLDFYIGVCWLHAGRAKQAVAALTRAVAANPRLAEYRWYLSQSLLQDGQGAEAARQLEKTARLAGSRRAKARDLARTVRALVGPGD